MQLYKSFYMIPYRSRVKIVTLMNLYRVKVFPESIKERRRGE